VASYDTRPENEMGLLCTAPEPTRGIWGQRPQKICVKKLQLQHADKSITVGTGQPGCLLLPQCRSVLLLSCKFQHKYFFHLQWSCAFVVNLLNTFANCYCTLSFYYEEILSINSKNQQILVTHRFIFLVADFHQKLLDPFLGTAVYLNHITVSFVLQ